MGPETQRQFSLSYKRLRLRYRTTALLSRRNFTKNWQKIRDVGHRKPDCPSVVSKIGLCRAIRIPDIIIHTGTRLLVICGKHTDGRGVSHRARLHFTSQKSRCLRIFLMWFKKISKYLKLYNIKLISQPIKPSLKCLNSEWKNQYLLIWSFNRKCLISKSIPIVLD